MLTPITNVPRDYAWGSTTLIAELEGRGPSGRPEAEVWFGDHPASPAHTFDGASIASITERIPGGKLPFLLKLLAADSPLSIQVHPTKEQAERGWLREQELPIDDPSRNYSDDNHKPEILVALSDRFEALCGLRPLAQTRAYFAALGEGQALDEFRARLEGPDEAAVLADVIGWLLGGDSAQTVQDISGALQGAQSEAFATELRIAKRIAAQYPSDPGVVVAMLMNVAVLQRGEGVYLRAGLLHAYLAGLGVELMAASDNVLRGGLTPKRVDVPELLRLVDTTPTPVEVLRPAELAGAVGAQTYGPGVSDFALSYATPSQGALTELPVTTPAIALATRGNISVSAGAEVIKIAPGQAVLVTGDDQVLRFEGEGEVFVATPGA